MAAAAAEKRDSFFSAASEAEDDPSSSSSSVEAPPEVLPLIPPRGGDARARRREAQAAVLAARLRLLSPAAASGRAGAAATAVNNASSEVLPAGRSAAAPSPPRTSRRRNRSRWRWTGRLVARVLPREWEEYDVKKPLEAQFDPGDVVKIPQEWETSGGGKSGGYGEETEEEEDDEARRRIAELTADLGTDCPDVLALKDEKYGTDLHGSSDEDLVVTLDLFLFRRYVPVFVPLRHASQSFSSFLSDRSVHGSSNGNGNGNGHGTGNVDRLCDDGENGDCSADGDDDSSSSFTSDNSDSSPRIDPNVVLHMHMKREASEPMVRTLRRLEISASKKLQVVIPVSGRGKRSRKKRTANRTMREGLSSSSVVIKDRSVDGWEWTTDCDEEEGEEDGGRQHRRHRGWSEIDVSRLTSADLWRLVAQRFDRDPDRRGMAGVLLSNPDLLDLQRQSGSGESGTPPPPPPEGLAYGERIRLDVVSCPPTILAVRTFENFSARVFAGVPLVVTAEVVYASRAVVTWYVGGKPVKHDAECYVPTEDDLGKDVSVLLVPIRPGHDGRGCEEAYRFRCPVETLPFMPIVSPIRDGFRSGRSPEGLDDLRVLTYNILADLYTSRDIDKHLMYSHCDLRHLTRWRRMPMLIYEILAYRADVICLQEVDDLIYETLLRPVLRAHGYQGFYSNKASSQREGCAMFWSLECFEEADPKGDDLQTINIRDVFAEHERVESGEDIGGGGGGNSPSTCKDSKRLARWESMDVILHLMGRHDELRRVTREKAGQILQVATLTLKKVRTDGAANRSSCRKPDKMVLANTHLFYHPMADHVRAVQAFAVCKKIDEIRRHDGTTHPYPLVFCGDLNSNPLSGAVQLLFNRALSPDHHDTWRHLHDYAWEMGDHEYMLEHGYIGNDETVEEPTWEDETFDDAHQDEESLAEAVEREEAARASKAAPGGKDCGGGGGGGGGLRVGNDKRGPSNLHPPPIALPSAFPNLVSGIPDMPKFTNYAVDFVETLDYVLASEPSLSSGPGPSSNGERYGFAPRAAAPMPSEEEVKRYVAMPNEFMPSDHVSVVCDLEWRVNDDGAEETNGTE